MHIFVTNLEKDVARRRFIIGQLEELKLAYEMVPGVYGAALSSEERTRHYNERKAKWRQSRKLTFAEIGCALSHLNIYRKMIERDIGYALILEDDVVLPLHLKEFLDECPMYLDPDRPSVWLLSPAVGDEDCNSKISIDPSHQLLPYLKGVYASS